jgi:hypothetical protein
MRKLIQGNNLNFRKYMQHSMTDRTSVPIVAVRISSVVVADSMNHVCTNTRSLKSRVYKAAPV